VFQLPELRAGAVIQVFVAALALPTANIEAIASTPSALEKVLIPLRDCRFKAREGNGAGDSPRDDGGRFVTGRKNKIKFEQIG
jgi:hypothetical protein